MTRFANYSALAAIAFVGIGTLTTGRVAQANPGYVASVEALNPTSYWQLNETTGTTAADSGTNGYTLNYGSGISIGQTGPETSNGFAGFGATNYAPKSINTDQENANGVVADTVNAHVPYGAGSGLPFSLVLWYNPGASSPSQGRPLVGWGSINGGNGGLAFGYNQPVGINDPGNDTLGLQPVTPGNADNDSLSFGSVLNGDAWHMLAITYDGTLPTSQGPTGSLQFYIDGVQKSLNDWNYSNTPFNIDNTSGGNDLITIFSERNGQSGGQVAGESITQVAFFGSALTPDDLTNLYNSALDPIDEGGGGGGPVPEPSTFVLAVLGLAGLGLVAWRKKYRRN